MDSIDQALLAAWNRISREVRAKRIRALKRSRRRFRAVLTQPMRETCLVIRAADTRINELSAIIDPRGAYDAREEHEVTIDGSLIRDITRPVMIDWPGVSYGEAARICGRDYHTIAGWAKSGIFRIERYAAFGFPRDGRRPLRTSVWTPSPIDPNAVLCEPPHPVWGTLWQWRWEKMPENYEIMLRRIPFFRTHHGKTCFRGWYFICPGRLDAEDNYKGCGRQCAYLYAPQTLWTLGKAINDLSGFDMPEDSGLAGQWVPALFDASKATGPRSFACRTCWKIRRAWMAHSMGWNDFITHISGGLLYGRDVPRPPDFPLEAIRYPKKGPKPKLRAAKAAAEMKATQRRAS
jgi:hypothetical protein